MLDDGIRFHGYKRRPLKKGAGKDRLVVQVGGELVVVEVRAASHSCVQLVLQVPATARVWRGEKYDGEGVAIGDAAAVAVESENGDRQP